LNQNVQTLLDGKGRIEDDESEAEREDIVGVSGLEEITNGTLFALVKIWIFPDDLVTGEPMQHVHNSHSVQRQI
jgi:hypothetical protein